MLLFSAFIVVPPASAGDLLSLYADARSTDPRFEAARYRYEAAIEAEPQAKAALFPHLSATYESVDTTQDIVRSDNTVFGQGQTSYPTTYLVINLRQPIFRYELWQGFKQAKAEVQQAQSEFAASEQDLVLRLIERYLGVLAASDGLALARAEKSAVDQHLDLVEARRASGLANRTDLYDARSRAAVAEVQVVEAGDALAEARDALAETVTSVPDVLQPLQNDIPLQPPEPADEAAWLDSAMQDNLRLAAAGHAVEAASRAMRVEKGGHYPTLDLVYSNSDRDTEGSLFGGGSQVKSTEMMLRLDIPIYAGGGTQSGVREATALLSQTESERRLFQRELSREVRSAYRGMVNGIEKVRSLKRSLEAQLGAVEAKQKAYGAGINTIQDILDAERDLFAIRREHAQSRYDFIIDSLRLKRAAGRLGESDVQAVDELLAEVGG